MSMGPRCGGQSKVVPGDDGAIPDYEGQRTRIDHDERRKHVEEERERWREDREQLISERRRQQRNEPVSTPDNVREILEEESSDGNGRAPVGLTVASGAYQGVDFASMLWLGDTAMPEVSTVWDLYRLARRESAKGRCIQNLFIIGHCQADATPFIGNSNEQEIIKVFERLRDEGFLCDPATITLAMCDVGSGELATRLAKELSEASGAEVRLSAGSYSAMFGSLGGWVIASPDGTTRKESTVISRYFWGQSGKKKGYK